MSLIKLAIFDLDGVITSTTEAHFKAWKVLFETHFKIELDEKLEMYTKGVSRKDSLEVLLNYYDLNIIDEEKEKLSHLKNLHYQKLVSSYDSTKLMPGVIKCLSYLKSKDLKIALGSASQNGSMLIQKLGIENYFDYVVNPLNKKGKPAPDIFLDASKHFKIPAKYCIAFEDAIAGAKAIKAANMFAIGIGDEPFENVDVVVKTLDDLTLEMLDKLINKRI